MKIEDIYSDLPALETERLILRKIKREDVEDIHTYASDPDVSKFVFWDSHQSLSATEDYVDFILGLYENGKIAPWGIQHKEDGKLIGTIDFVSWQTQHKTAEMGYALSKDYWGRGIATEAAMELIRFGFNNMELVRIQAKCLVANTGSERVMEKAGMSFEGVLRKFIFIKGVHYDVKMYSILNEAVFA
ncbi:GNAT family N-acetyltransferase [Mesobacillus subterraneus]|uniref:GNAT family N-acetyltransferase n=1 Tax=Mesobacillus subterraneus TaxID=285983 RepID=UPI00203D447D|nr:GNAT family protein [Mesobacillus subterraneus]MCM3664986.1 GNAT family N-acetyltransferase [Mesobacillus subterraneus]MCM3682073.1 GNAT family N-acetyltransferase [Mesobacillus subterraneus]